MEKVRGFVKVLRILLFNAVQTDVHPNQKNDGPTAKGALGILLLANKFQPLALVVLFPVLLNAILFHVLLDPPSIAGPATLAVAMNIFLMFSNTKAYNQLLKAS